jgi:hypothetical protein
VSRPADATGTRYMVRLTNDELLELWHELDKCGHRGDSLMLTIGENVEPRQEWPAPGRVEIVCPITGRRMIELDTWERARSLRIAAQEQRARERAAARETRKDGAK